MQQLSEQYEMGVSGFSVSPDNATLCVTSLADVATLWDLNSLEKIAALPHPDCANCSTFVTESRLMTACEDGTVLVWDNRKLDEPTYTLRGFKEGVNKLVIADNTLYSACDDGHVYVHSMETDMPLLDKWWVSSNTVNDLIVDTPSGLLVACAEDCSIKALKLGEYRNLETDDRVVGNIDEFQFPINHIAVHNGTMYAAMSEFVFDFQFDIATASFGGDAKAFEGHEDFIRGIHILGDNTLVTVSDDGTGIEWSIETHEPCKRYAMHEAQIMASEVLYANGEPNTLVTGGEDGTVRLWKLPLADNAPAAGSN